MVQLAKKHKPEAILVGGTMRGREFAPYVANSLRTGITADCTSFDVDPKTGDIIQIRPPFGAWMLAHIRTATRRPVMSTARPNVFSTPKRNESRKGKIIKEKVKELPDPGVRLVERLPIEKAEEVPIEKAEILVSGGKGLGSKEGFKLLEELARVIGGAVSGSRKAVDAGWIPHEKQVGQTGKTVKPSVYLAIGISGAAQHIFGIREAKCVVCINIDPEAPIFENSDYGIVGDYKQVVPALIEAIKKLKKG
jgi:electron transfer flavoprotein alpha subunit